MTDSIASDTLIVPVDRDHSRLRFSIAIIFVILWIGTFAILNSIMQSEGFNLIAGILGLIVAIVGGRLIEPILQRRWPSGRTFHLSETGARLMLHDTVQSQIKSDETANVLLWQFKIPRRSRMPKGWYVVACALHQGDTYLPFYTFASPEISARLNRAVRFTELESQKKNPDKARVESLRAAGEQRRLLTAEEHRWHDGAEMGAEDFERVMQKLNGFSTFWII
ncbi:MAG: hypothetical protein JNJ78_00915 [Anaerolineae bacterium]|nr:hypothetical protein [Anaerolineae bacterium]